MSYLVVNVGTDRAYGKHSWDRKVYSTERAAKGVCTRLNREYSGYDSVVENGQDVVQWKVMSLAAYNAREVKMVERTNLMTGKKFMEAEDTPNFCSPASESYWSM